MRSHWYFLLKLTALSAFLGILTAFLVMKIAIRGGEETMPDLVGKPSAMATSQLHQIGISLKVDDQRFSNAQPNDCILSQDIPAGSRIKRGRTVHVVLSKGSSQVVTPEVTGMSLRQAQILMQQNGLESGTVDHIYSSEAPETVLAQSPDPGTSLNHDSSVSLLVSDGPEPVNYLMPDFVGKSLELCQSVLNQMGLFIKGVNQVASNQPAGVVLSQSVPARSPVGRGAELSLTIAKGAESAAGARFVSIQYQVPQEGVTEKRVRITVFDALGTHVVHNEMEKPGAKLSIPFTAHGKAHYQVSLSGVNVVETDIP